MVDTVISHYRVLKRRGEGGMGEVFLAEDLRLRRLVALKTLRPDTAGNAEARARFFQEARAASVPNHPNLAVIYEVDEAATETGSLALIAFECVDGESIVEHALERVRCPPPSHSLATHHVLHLCPEPRRTTSPERAQCHSQLSPT